jgi:hypothetical protein
VLRLPLQCTFWRFLASLPLSVASRSCGCSGRCDSGSGRPLTWASRLRWIPTLRCIRYSAIRWAGRKSYNPKNKGKKSYQPILTFLAETREYVGGELRNGDRPTGRQIARHLEGVFAALPAGVETIYARADSGFYCAEAVEAYEKAGVQFLISARKTGRLVDELKAAEWTGSPQTDADGQCEFRYQPEGWRQAYRFIALRYEKKQATSAADTPEQYQLLDTPENSSRVFATNMTRGIALLTWFYNQRAGAENLIKSKKPKNDAGMADHPSARWAVNCITSSWPCWLTTSTVG